MTISKRSPKTAKKVVVFRKILASLPKEKGQSTKTDEVFELLEQLVQMQRKQYVVSARPSTNTMPI